MPVGIGDIVLYQVTPTRVRPAILVDIRSEAENAADLHVFNAGTNDGLSWDAPSSLLIQWVVNDESDPPAVGSWHKKPVEAAPAPAPTEIKTPTA